MFLFDVYTCRLTRRWSQRCGRFRVHARASDLPCFLGAVAQLLVVRRLGAHHMRRFIQLVLLATAASIVAGCSTRNAVPSKSVVNDPNGNFHLYVSDQSFAISPVDIRIFIDGELVVKGDFDVGSQHNFQSYVLKLSPGQHKIIAESSKGHAKLEQIFEINDKLWADLSYWFYPKPEGGVLPCPRHFSRFHCRRGSTDYVSVMTPPNTTLEPTAWTLSGSRKSAKFALHSRCRGSAWGR